MNYGPHIHWTGCPTRPYPASFLKEGDLLNIDGRDIRKVVTIEMARPGEMKLTTTRYRGRHRETVGTFTDSTFDVVDLSACR